MTDVTEFQRGARAMFDALMTRAANNYHGNPAINDQCNLENKLVEEWAVDALEEIDPESHREWLSIGEAYERGLGRRK